DAHVTLDDAGSLTLSGGVDLFAGPLHLNGGSLQAGSALGIAAGALFDGSGNVSGLDGISVSGTVIASDATSGHVLDFNGDVTGSGTFQIVAGATLEFGGAVASGTTVTFLGGTGELKLDYPQHFNGTIVG